MELVMVTENLEVTKMVATENELEIEVKEFLDSLEEDETVDVIIDGEVHEFVQYEDGSIRFYKV